MDTASSFLLNRQNTRNSAATTDLCSTMERADCLFLPTSNAHAMNFLSLSIETESQSCIGRKRRVSAGSGCGRSFSTSANCGDVSPHYALHYYTAETYRLRELLQQQLLNVEASIYSFTDLVVPGQVHSLIAARTFYHILLLATYGEIQVQQPTTADPILLSMVSCVIFSCMCTYAIVCVRYRCLQRKLYRKRLRPYGTVRSHRCCPNVARRSESCQTGHSHPCLAHPNTSPLYFLHKQRRRRKRSV